MSEINTLQTDIILSCAFGQNKASVTLPYLHKGKTKFLSVGAFLKEAFAFNISRSMRYEMVLIPYLLFFHYSKEDKEFLKNIKTVRDYARGLIKERR